jgi:hypothetical protein
MRRLIRYLTAITARGVGGLAPWLGWCGGLYLGYQILLVAIGSAPSQHPWHATFRSWLPSGAWDLGAGRCANGMLLFSAPVVLLLGGMIGRRIRELLVTAPRRQQLAERQRQEAERQRIAAEDAAKRRKARGHALSALQEIIDSPAQEIVVCGTCGRRYRYSDFVITYREVERPHYQTVTDCKVGCPSCQSSLYRFETEPLNLYRACRACGYWFVNRSSFGAGSGRPECPLCHPPAVSPGETGGASPAAIPIAAPRPIPSLSQWFAAAVLLVAAGTGARSALGQSLPRPFAYATLTRLAESVYRLGRELIGEGDTVIASSSWATYRSSRDGFRISYPSNWSVIRTRPASVASPDFRRTILRPPSGGGRMVVDVVHTRTTGDQYHLFRQMSRRFERRWPGRYQLHSLERRRLGGAPGAEWVFTLAESGRSRLKKLDVGTNVHGTIYAVMAEAQPETFERMRPLFQRAVASFRRIP